MNLVAYNKIQLQINITCTKNNIFLFFNNESILLPSHHFSNSGRLLNSSAKKTM